MKQPLAPNTAIAHYRLLALVDAERRGEIEPPKELFALSDSWAARNVGYASTRDGNRFLFVTSAEETNLTPFTVVQN